MKSAFRRPLHRSISDSLSTGNISMFDSESLRCSSVLLVTAHPDDEVMFFAPTIHHLQQQGSGIHIMCLSNGNGAGLGPVRKKELLAAAGILKIPLSHVVVVNHPALQDGMHTRWSTDIVARHVEQQLLKMPCDMVLTFDSQGVSGHLNHCCVHDGVSWLLAAKGSALGVQHAWQLVSESILVKFTCLLAVLVIKLLQKPGQLVVRGGRLCCSLKAMAAHRSQFVWYRKLFVLLSSYTYVNRLRRLPVG